MKTLVKAALLLVLLCGLTNSCTEQPLDHEKEMLTEPGDSSNSGGENPPPPTNGEG